MVLLPNGRIVIHVNSVLGKAGSSLIVFEMCSLRLKESPTRTICP